MKIDTQSQMRVMNERELINSQVLICTHRRSVKKQILEKTLDKLKIESYDYRG